jgi:ABC-type sugar transport system substrate-binding protein
MTSRRAIAATLTIMLLASGVAVAGDSQPPILLLLKSADNEFFKSIEAGVRQELRKKGVSVPLEVKAGSQESDVTAQQQILEAFVQTYASGGEKHRSLGVILTPAGSGDELVGEIAKLRAARVPVILLDTRIDKMALKRGHASYNLFAGSSNKAGGELAAQLIRKKLPKGGHVLLLNGVQGTETAMERRRGFLNGVAKRTTKGVHYDVAEKTADWRRNDAQAVVSALLSTGHSYVAIFAANDEMALGAVAAYRQVGVSPLPVIVGFDAITPARTSVAACELYATIAQDPFQMGIRAVDALYDEAHGRHSEGVDVVIPVKAIVCGR